MRIVSIAPHGVHPPRSAGHAAIWHPLAEYAGRDHRVDLISVGLRRFERRWPRSYVSEVREGFCEHRVVRAGELLLGMLKRTTRLAPVDLARSLERGCSSAMLELVAKADVVELESPWSWPFVERHARGAKVLVAHNLELALHEAALHAHGGDELVARARAIEAAAWQHADLVCVWGDDDARAFEREYGKRQGAVLSQEIGADVASIQVPSAERRAAARAELGISGERLIALFAASAHAPNVEALAELERRAVDLEHVEVLVAGSVADTARRFVGGRVTGPLPSLDVCYAAADFAINPMLRGSGMNLKVAEALAWGLPVVSTRIGARGYLATPEDGLIVCEIEDFVATMDELARDEQGPEADAQGRSARLEKLAQRARARAEAAHDWSNIAKARLAAIDALMSEGATSQA